MGKRRHSPLLERLLKSRSMLQQEHRHVGNTPRLVVSLGSVVRFARPSRRERA